MPVTNIEFKELTVVRVKKGVNAVSAKADDIYEQYAKGVYRYLFSLTGNADMAEELTQETFCQAIKNLDGYRGESSPQVWLCAIGKRLWFKELERRKRTVPADEEFVLNIAAPNNVEKDYENKENRLALYRAMQKLDIDTREVIHLRLAGEFSFRDIGEILGKSEVWARVRFYRGKEELAKIIGGDKDE